MYAICKTIHPPTQIEHCVYCHFYNREEKNLITAGATQLKVFRLILEVDDDENSSNEFVGSNEPMTNDASKSKESKVKLECCQTFSFFGNIMSIESVSLSDSSRDSLLIGFSDAKLSIVEYDPNTHDLKTLSLHYFEEDEMKIGYNSSNQVPVVRADPEGRCAAFLIYNKNIVILPFRKEIISDDHDSHIPMSTSSPQTSVPSTPSLGAKSPVLASYKLDLNTEQYGDKVNNIIDIEFLYNYYEPTLLILYEPIRTWAGRVAVRQDTCSMLVLSLNVQQRVHPHIWSMSHLPFDCFRAIAVPKPIGGVVIFAVNSLIHLNQGLPPYGISLNSFTDFSTSFPLKVQDEITISLDCSHACFISNEKLVISLKNGDLYVLNLFNDMTRSIRGFNFDKAASSVLTTCMTYCGNQYLFLGSRLGHSLLLHFTEKPYEEKQDKNDKADNDLDISDSNDVKPNLTNSEHHSDDEDLSAYNDDDDVEEASNRVNNVKQEKEEMMEIDNDNGNDNDNENKNDNGNDNNEKTGEQTENIGNWVAGDVALIEDPDILEVYGAPSTNIDDDKGTKTTLSFEVCDSIINIAPCGRICMGETVLLADEFSKDAEPDIELVSTSGFGKNGALSVLQRTVRPQILNTFEIRGCIDMWTLYGPEPSNSQNEQQTHAFLVLSRQDATMVLQTGQELNELDQSGFSSQTSTVFAGNLGNNQYIIQVSPMGVRLLDGIKELQHLPIDVGSPICSASLADPFVILLSENGVVLFLCLKIDDEETRLMLSRPELVTKPKIVSICVYKDVSGMFTTVDKIDYDKVEKNIKTEEKQEKSENLSSQITIPTVDIDDEDELLYGDSEIDISKPFVKKPELKEPEKVAKSKIYEIKSCLPTFWLFIVRENGIMEIYSLPDLKLVYLIKNFPMAPKVLVDSVQITDHIGVQQQQESLTSSMPITRELLITGMGVKNSRPILFARFDDDLLIYEAFPFYEIQVENHLKLRFKKLSHNVMVKEPKIANQSNNESETNEKNNLPNSNVWLRCFNEISGYSGVFICGPYPHWFFMSYRGELRAHEMNIDGPVLCFSTFNNINCPKGFLYFNNNNDLRICTLTKHLNYDSYWPVRKVPLRCTPHFVNYHVDSKTYCVVISIQEEVEKIVRIGGEEKDYDVLERDSRHIFSTTEKFLLNLVSPVSWEMIPGTKIELDEWEHVTCLKNVMLVSEGTESGLKGYIALGTNYNYGEDVTNRGRIWILDIIEVVPEPGQPLTKNKIKIVYCKEQKGPVTALCQVSGFLLTAIGQKIYIWQLKESQLIGVAFIDTQIYIHSALSLKNLILIADVYKSISLLRYQEETRTLSLVSKDPRSLQVYACDYVIDNSQLCFIISDSEKNFILYSYQPDVRESFGGTRLLRRADYHYGSLVNAFFRIRCKLPVKNIDNRTKQSILNKQMTMFASLDGSLGYVMPLNEKLYRRLLMLQNVLTFSLQHSGGLNPKAFRLLRLPKPELLNPSKNVVDGDLLSKFRNLSINEKLECAKKIGTTPSQIIDDLHEIDLLAAYF